MGMKPGELVSGVRGKASPRRSVSRVVRALGEQRGTRVPASADLSLMSFALVVAGAGEEYARRPLRRTGAMSGSHLEEVPRVGPWAAQGACRNQTDLFFPIRGQRPHSAIALCEACPVLEQCRAHGLSNPAQLGVLGSLTVEERRRVRAEMRGATKAARGSEEHPLFAVLEDLARYPVLTWGEIGRSASYDGTVQLAFELGAGWRPLPPGRWEFDAEGSDNGGILRARLARRDLSMLARLPVASSDLGSDLGSDEDGDVERDDAHDGAHNGVRNGAPDRVRAPGSALTAVSL
jgi:WhiB family redox-sensing transcriptional regulator